MLDHRSGSRNRAVGLLRGPVTCPEPPRCRAWEAPLGAWSGSGRQLDGEESERRQNGFNQ